MTDFIPRKFVQVLILLIIGVSCALWGGLACSGGAGSDPQGLPGATGSPISLTNGGSGGPTGGTGSTTGGTTGGAASPGTVDGPTDYPGSTAFPSPPSKIPVTCQISYGSHGEVTGTDDPPVPLPKPEGGLLFLSLMAECRFLNRMDHSMRPAEPDGTEDSGLAKAGMTIGPGVADALHAKLEAFTNDIWYRLPPTSLVRIVVTHPTPLTHGESIPYEDYEVGEHLEVTGTDSFRANIVLKTPLPVRAHDEVTLFFYYNFMTRPLDYHDDQKVYSMAPDGKESYATFLKSWYLKRLGGFLIGE